MDWSSLSDAQVTYLLDVIETLSNELSVRIFEQFAEHVGIDLAGSADPLTTLTQSLRES